MQAQQVWWGEGSQPASQPLVPPLFYNFGISLDSTYTFLPFFTFPTPAYLSGMVVLIRDCRRSSLAFSEPRAADLHHTGRWAFVRNGAAGPRQTDKTDAPGSTTVQDMPRTRHP